MGRVLLTGAAGALGSTLRRGLTGYERLRVCDVVPLTAENPLEDSACGDLADMAVALAATRGIDCVVHMAGTPREAPWEPVLRNNIEAVYNLFEAARLNGVRRIVFASSNHVIGYYPAGENVDAAALPRPDSRYGVSKVFGEALARLYADKHGMEIACLRIGSFRERPENRRQLATWISKRDLVQLVQRCVDAQPFGFIVLYGVSANRRRAWFDDAATLVGYAPEDDAEDYAESFASEPDADPLAAAFHGGEYCALEVSGDPARLLRPSR